MWITSWRALVSTVLAFAALTALAPVASAEFGQLESFGSFGGGDGQFQSRDPGPIAVHGPDGQVFVADYNTNTGTATFRIVEFDLDGNFVRTFAAQSAPAATGVFDRGFSGIAVNTTLDELYVLRPQITASTSKIEKYSTVTGAKLADFVANANPFESLDAIEVDPVNGAVIVAGTQGDDADPKLRKFNSNGSAAGGTFGVRGTDTDTDEGEFNDTIADIAVRHNGAADSNSAKVYVLDFWLPEIPEEPALALLPEEDSPRIQRFTVTNNGWSYDNDSAPVDPDLDSQFFASEDSPFLDGTIAADASGNLYVSGTSDDAPSGESLLKLSETGTKQLQWGSLGLGACQFGRQPRHVVVGPSDTLFVVDPGAQPPDLQTGRRVLQFGEGGTGCGFGNQPPTSSFTINPFAPKRNQLVTFDGSTSSDPNVGDTIVKYEWDLDGNVNTGVDGFEVDSGGTTTTNTSYATLGSRDVRLRVTDEGGLTHVTTQVLTVVNTNPTAAFSLTPASPVLTGVNVTFNGSGSGDTDGSITKYEWDLDGNGTFERDTGTTSSTSQAFASAGSLTIRLRVTDNDGGSAQTTRSLTVNAPTTNPPPGGGGGGTPAPAPVTPFTPPAVVPSTPPQKKSACAGKKGKALKKCKALAKCKKLKGKKKRKCQAKAKKIRAFARP